MKAIIFGVTGQDGHYLRRLCEARQIHVIGAARSSRDLPVDVREFETVRDLIRREKPDWIFHLAANSTTQHKALFENHETISTGTLNVLEAAWQFAPQSKAFIAGSAVQFLNQGEPLSEIDEFCGSSPYAVARIHSTFAARYYRSIGLKAYVGFLFHHESPFRKPEHVSKRIAATARRIKNGEESTLSVGNLSVEKEWTFAGDTAEAMVRLLEQDEVFEAVIGSGETHSIRDWVEKCFGILGLDWRAHVQEIGGFKAEYNRLLSNPERMRNLGWRPKIGFDELARMMVTEGLPQPS